MLLPSRHRSLAGRWPRGVRGARKQRRDFSPVRLGSHRRPDGTTSSSAGRSGDRLHRSCASRDRSGGAGGGGDDAGCCESDSFIVHNSRCGGSAENRRSPSARRARRACWCASPARESWSTMAPIIPSVTATSCSCRRRSARVPTGRAAPSAVGSRAAGIVPAWRDRGGEQSQECGNSNHEKARRFRPGRYTCRKQIIS